MQLYVFDENAHSQKTRQILGINQKLHMTSVTLYIKLKYIEVVNKISVYTQCPFLSCGFEPPTKNKEIGCCLRCKNPSHLGLYS